MNEDIRNQGTLSTADIAGSDRREMTTEGRQDDEHYFAGGAGGAGVAKDPSASPLFTPDEVQRFRSEWNSIQTGFVDEPRRAVEEADQLVAQTMKRLAEMFSEERRKLEQQWDREGDVSTEDLRVALQRYRSFFSRLMSI